MASITINDLANAKVDVDHISELATSPSPTAVDRFGRTKSTVKGAIDSLKAFNVRGAFVANTPYAIKDVYTFAGVAYVVVVSHVSTNFASDLAAGKVTVHQGATREELALTGAMLNGWRREALGAAMRTVADVLDEDVRVTDFMDFGQRNSLWLGTLSVDCSDAVNEAIAYCLLHGKNLLVSGRCRIDKPLMIDRATDSTTNEFRIKGTNANAGFWTSNPIFIFSSTLLGYGTREDFPGSEFTIFESIRFEASDNTLDCFAVDGEAFLRMRFDRCYFRAIRCAHTFNLFQTWSFNLCNIRQMRGIFLEAAIAGPSFLELDGFGFDIHITDCIMEEGDQAQSAFMKLAGQYSGGDQKGNLFEGCTGPFIECYGGQGVSANGNYFEGVIDSVYKIGPSYNFTFMGNRFGTSLDPSYWAIDCQNAYTVIGFGNYADGNMYKISGMQSTAVMNGSGFYNSAAKGLISWGDVAYQGYLTDDPTHAQQIDKIRSRFISMGLSDFSQGNVTQLVARMQSDGVSGMLPASQFNFYTVPGFRATARLEIKVADGPSGELARATFALTAKGQEIYTPDADMAQVVTNDHPSFPGAIQAKFGANVNSQAGTFLDCNAAGITRLRVYGNGGIGSYQANNVNLSDERTKHEIVPLGSYWAKWKALDFVTFRYIDQDDPRPNIGLIAQQVEAAAPEFVSNDGFGGDDVDDAVRLKTIFTTDLYHAMGKVVQELQSQVEQLKAQVAELQAHVQ